MAELIAYFSRADENYFNGTLKYIEKGNTEIAAETLQKLSGADIFRIQPVQPYAKDYNECIAQAQADLRRNARPELKEYPESLDGYDTIYLVIPTTGEPCLWRYSHSWNTLISAAGSSGRSAHTREAAWETARLTSEKSVRIPG